MQNTVSAKGSRGLSASGAAEGDHPLSPQQPASWPLTCVSDSVQHETGSKFFGQKSECLAVQGIISIYSNLHALEIMGKLHRKKT